MRASEYSVALEIGDTGCPFQRVYMIDAPGLSAAR